MVGVFVPPPPFPHSSYLQLASRISTSSLAPSTSASQPPTSAAPSFVSFDSQGSGSSANFDAERYRALYRMSQENLVFQQAQFEEEREMTRRRQEERERRQREHFEVERALLESRILALERTQPREDSHNAASGTSSHGGSRRR